MNGRKAKRLHRFEALIVDEIAKLSASRLNAVTAQHAAKLAEKAFQEAAAREAVWEEVSFWRLVLISVCPLLTVVLQRRGMIRVKAKRRGTK